MTEVLFDTPTLKVVRRDGPGTFWDLVVTPPDGKAVLTIVGLMRLSQILAYEVTRMTPS
jgi:hypothetical protein